MKINAGTNPSSLQFGELKEEDFANLFGTTVRDLPEECRDLITQTDFKFRILFGGERDEVLLRILKRIDEGFSSVSGPEYKDRWEKGWSENLRQYNQTGDVQELIPKFVKKNEVVRLGGNYVMPSNHEFETAFVTVLRNYLFKKYFKDVDSIYEFGCGTGHNLVSLAKLFPKKQLHGLDWTKASCKIIDKLAEDTGYKIESHLFDMFKPDENLPQLKESGVLTIGAMEQLGEDYMKFLDFLLERSPSICIHVETCYESYNQDKLFDYVAARYLQARNYLKGYLNELKKLEKERKIELIAYQKTFGSLFHDGYNFIVWKAI